MTKSSKEKKANVIWRFFSSVRLIIALLIIIAIVSILGTVIPQQDGAVEFARGLSPELFRLFSTLDLFDMYHAFWFRFLIGCLVLNILICSIDRFPGTWKLSRAMPGPERSKPFDNLPPQQTFKVSEDVKGASALVNQVLKRRFRRIIEKEADSQHFYYGEKGRYSRFGVYLVHLSVVMILIGALVGSFLGFAGYVNIMEGEQIDSIKLKKGVIPFKLGFEVRCDSFTVDFYENGAPKEYKSQLSFLVNGELLEKRSLLVNHPAQFRGVTFYQASYGSVPGKKIRLKISQDKGEQNSILDVEAGSPAQLPGNEGEFSIIDAREAFMNSGSAALISIRPENGEEKQFWIFQEFEKIRKRLPGPMLKSPKFDPSAFKPYTFFLDGVESSYYTGLQVNKDPGVPIVWGGFFLIIAGFLVTFFMSHRRVWIRLSGEARVTRISVAGVAN
ncbi:MAG: cytochrome c biogenesis protein ResB, partial [Desulfobacterales bacterium]|nr:cytochrome c biogenesis protein ResB [Desulfobacterales bacterium]